MATKRSKAVRTRSSKSEDQPATRKMLGLVRKEVLQKMDSGFNRMEARFTDIDARFKEQDAKFIAIDARFNKLDASFSRMEFLLEEQNANNRIVLEGLQALWQRQDRLEEKVNSRQAP